MSIQPELKTVLKRLKLSGMLATLPDRVAYARKEKLDYTQFLELSFPTKSNAAIRNTSPIVSPPPALKKSARWNGSIGRRTSASIRRA